jgi:heme-degrading monooxygenase HmoA
MQVVIFEVDAKPGRRQDYLDLAAALRAELERVEGFLSVERFESLSGDGKVLSLSFWRDGEAVRRWREQAQHRRAQVKGRSELFYDYRITVAEVLRQYGAAAVAAREPQP